MQRDSECFYAGFRDFKSLSIVKSRPNCHGQDIKEVWEGAHLFCVRNGI